MRQKRAGKPQHVTESFHDRHPFANALFGDANENYVRVFRFGQSGVYRTGRARRIPCSQAWLTAGGYGPVDIS